MKMFFNYNDLFDNEIDDVIICELLTIILKDITDNPHCTSISHNALLNHIFLKILSAYAINKNMNYYCIAYPQMTINGWHNNTINENDFFICHLGQLQTILILKHKITFNESEIVFKKIQTIYKTIESKLNPTLNDCFPVKTTNDQQLIILLSLLFKKLYNQIIQPNYDKLCTNSQKIWNIFKV